MFRVQILVSPLTNCASLGNSFDLSNPHFPYLKNFVNTDLAGLLYALDEMYYM